VDSHVPAAMVQTRPRVHPKHGIQSWSGYSAFVSASAFPARASSQIFS
jgi:hypothetical protein